MVNCRNSYISEFEPMTLLHNSVVFFWVLIVAAVLFLSQPQLQHKLSNFSHTHSSSMRRTKQESNETTTTPPRPIMHTFFEPIEQKKKKNHTKGSINTGSGMSTPEAHKRLLDAWQKAWEEAGWSTRILTLEDAMAYPQYDQVRDSIDQGIFRQYDTLCFLRWFAMVSNGGGWMSDYDVFPLAANIPPDILGKTGLEGQIIKHGGLSSSEWSNNGGIPLPNDGKFTAYDNGGMTPSLLSGSQKDWDRVAKGLIEMEQLHLDGFYSDMLALDDYIDVNPGDIVKEYSVAWSLARVMVGVGQIDCQKVWGEKNKFWAVHFSHWNVKDGVNKSVLEGGLRADDRPDIAAGFLKEFEQQCANGTRCEDGITIKCY